jgi:hypothetical protein
VGHKLCNSFSSTTSVPYIFRFGTYLENYTLGIMKVRPETYVRVAIRVNVCYIYSTLTKI